MNNSPQLGTTNAEPKVVNEYAVDQVPNTPFPQSDLT